MTAVVPSKQVSFLGIGGGGSCGCETGTHLLLKYEGITTPGSEVDLISYTVPVAKKLLILQVLVSCRLETKIKVMIDAASIATCRTGPAVINANICSSSYKEYATGSIFKVTCRGDSWRPASDIEVFVQARLI